MDQQCQTETFHGFTPCSLLSKRSLLAWTIACAWLCSSSIVFVKFPGRPQDQPTSDSHEIWLWIRHGIYTNRYVNVLEVSFVLSLIVLTVVAYCIKNFRENQLIVE